MATRDEIYDAIRVADKAGRKEDVAKLGAYLATMDAPAALTDDSAMRGAALGLSKVADNAILGLSKVPVVGPLVDKAYVAMGLPTAQGQYDQLQGQRAANTRTGYQTLGNIAGAAPTMALPGGVLAQGAVGGALLSDAKDAQGLAIDTAGGAIGGMVGEKATRGIGAVIAPKLSAAAQRLTDMGVPLTLGQIGRASGTVAGKIGAFIEDAAANTLPIAGTMINRARKEGVTAFNRAITNKVIEPLGVSLPAATQAGHDAVAFAKKAFNRAYDDTLAQMKVVVDPALKARFDYLAGLGDSVPGNAKAILQNVVKEFVEKRADRQTGELTGDAMKLAVRDLRAKAKALRGDGSGELAGLIDDVHVSLMQKAAADSPKGLGRRLAKIDDAYGNFVVLRSAAKGPVDGVFTPAQLNTAIGVTDKSVGKGAKATNNARLQHESKDASAVLPSTIGDSGTAARVVQASLLSGLGGGGFALGGAAGAGGAIAPILAADAALSIPYTRAGQKAIAAAFAPGVKRTAIRDIANRLAIPIGVASPALIASSRK